MNFKLDFPIAGFPSLISSDQPVMLMGSCFAENIYEKLRQYKFDAICNPNGILFNPISIANALNSYTQAKFNPETQVFETNNRWHSWWHHGSFMGSTKETLLKQINEAQQQAHHALTRAQWLIITWGSAYVYTHNESKLLVANCHKVSANKFTKKLLSVDEIVQSYQTLLKSLTQINPELNIMFSISPVRYTRDGLHENNLSKGTLHLALKQLMDQYKNLTYFPAYEIVVDELRDYRFFETDWVHPNPLAINYVWERFTTTCIDKKANEFLKLFEPILHAMQHKPIHEKSPEHLLFKSAMLQKVLSLKQQFPGVSLQKEIDFFTAH